MTSLAEDASSRADHPSNRLHPGAWRAATLAAKERAQVGEDGVGQVEHSLEWSECEGPCEPPGIGQTAEDFRNSLPTQLHGAIGHEEMNRRIGIPNTELRIERPKRLGVITNRSDDEARLSRLALRRLPDPIPDVTANIALVVEQQDWLCPIRIHFRTRMARSPLVGHSLRLALAPRCVQLPFRSET